MIITKASNTNSTIPLSDRQKTVVPVTPSSSSLLLSTIEQSHGSSASAAGTNKRATSGLKQVKKNITKKWTTTKQQNLFQLMYYKLRWTDKPNRFIPHGISGCVVLLIGYYFTFCSLSGYLDPYGLPNAATTSSSLSTTTTTAAPPSTLNSILFVIFYIAAVMNAVGGYMLAPTAIKVAVPIFRVAAMMQICLVYWSIRFHPVTFFNLTASLSNTLTRYMDVLFALGTVRSVWGFVMAGYNFYNVSRAICVAVTIGAACLSTLTFYPIQTAYDPEWYECTVQQYPFQGMACTAYIYIPAITIFSTTAFLATVYLRHMITDFQLAVMVIGFVGSILITTVLSMEWHITDISTQSLYIPCDHIPIEGTWEYYFWTAGDLSTKSKYFYKYFFGTDVPQSSYLSSLQQQSNSSFMLLKEL